VASIVVHPEVLRDPTLRELAPIALTEAGRSSAGWPYLSRPGWARFRDWVPHILAEGPRVAAAADRLEELAGAPLETLAVVRQVLRTATVTAPPDLWLLRHVLSALARTGWIERLTAGVRAVPAALDPEVGLLLGRGYVVRTGEGGVRWAEEPTARRVLAVDPLPADRPADLSWRWAGALAGDPAPVDLLLSVAAPPVPSAPHPPPAWIATPEDLEIGYRLVPLLLGLRAAGRIAALLDRGAIDPAALAPLPAALASAAISVLGAAGWMAADGTLTGLGRRGLERAPGPFGIIEAYHGYAAALPRIWEVGRQGVHVARAANIGASQDANRATFERANAALDRFCADTGFRYTVFVEHAVGRGEAIRQRWKRSGDAIAYVGADLEEPAIAEARNEQAAGRLPPGMRFVRADIANPAALVAALRSFGLEPNGAVMLVGNGFHEVRDRSDSRMIEVFRGYEAAGIVLLFTEESALSVEDLLRTAWNTYHASFRYVHERSGQGLRPATPSPATGMGPPLPASWLECATRAGYVRLDRYGSRSRTVYPYPPPNGHNPAVSTNLFFLPATIAATLPNVTPG